MTFKPGPGPYRPGQLPAMLVANRLMDCEETARSIHGEAWPARRREVRTLIEELATRERKTVLEAAMTIAKAQPATAYMALAAVVEVAS